MSRDMIINVNGEKRIIGKINGNRFITFRSKLHFVRKYKGFGINKEALQELIDNDIDEIVVIYSKNKKEKEVYKVSPKIWRYRGYNDKLGEFETQVFLPLKLFPQNEDNEEKRTRTKGLNEF